MSGNLIATAIAAFLLFPLVIGDWRLKKRRGNLLRCQSTITNRKSQIPAILHQTVIEDIFRKPRRSLEPVLEKP
jgi:hypothetical protein